LSSVNVFTHIALRSLLQCLHQYSIH
jgi:hypothetical protein